LQVGHRSVIPAAINEHRKPQQVPAFHGIVELLGSLLEFGGQRSNDRFLVTFNELVEPIEKHLHIRWGQIRTHQSTKVLRFLLLLELLDALHALVGGKSEQFGPFSG
jgi:hypothetical protein